MDLEFIQGWVIKLACADDLDWVEGESLAEADEWEFGGVSVLPGFDGGDRDFLLEPATEMGLGLGEGVAGVVI